MPVRARLTLMLVATLALVGALAVVLLVDAEPETSGFAGSIQPDIPPQDFTLTDQDGRPTRLSDFRGRPVIVTFLYSTCQDTCPVTASQIRGALDDLDDPPPALAISVDPANDTPERAKRFLAERRLTGRMRFLLGSRAELAPIWKAYGIRPQGAGFEHSAYVLLIDAAGRSRVSFPLDKLTPEGLRHDVERLAQSPVTRSDSSAMSSRSAAAQ